MTDEVCLLHVHILVGAEGTDVATPSELPHGSTGRPITHRRAFTFWLSCVHPAIRTPPHYHGLRQL